LPITFAGPGLPKALVSLSTTVSIPHFSPNNFPVDDRNDRNEQEELYSQRVKAGKRTYFFDVKATRAQDYYLTITESRRRTNPDESVSYEKHKIFLYKEDFLKFVDALQDAVDYVREELLTPEEVAELDRPRNDASLNGESGMKNEE